MKVNFSHVIRGNILEIVLKEANCDALNASLMKDKLLELITQSGSSKVVLDLSQVQFIDSSGLGAFLAIQRTLYNQGGKLKIAHLE